jgi:hypothetical protein
MALRFGGASVAENLRQAIATGQLVEGEDGALRLPDDQPDVENWIFVRKGRAPECGFLMHFMFDHVYGRSAVPQGCSCCYKVKVMPKTLRELVAAWQIGSRIDCHSKWGIDLENIYSENVYAGYFYTFGLDEAREIFKTARELIDRDPKLGPEVEMAIKRGCSEYEVSLGPSDQYEFAPELADLENHLKTRFRNNRGCDRGNIALAYWIDVAFRTGDTTYLDFTGGKRLRPKTVSYEP